MNFFVFFSILFSSLVSSASQERPLFSSLMFFPHEIKTGKEAEMFPEQTEPQKGLLLKGIIYENPHKWVLWINEEKVFSETSMDHPVIDILTVTPSSLIFRWKKRPEDPPITLFPNQFSSDPEF